MKVHLLPIKTDPTNRIPFLKPYSMPQQLMLKDNPVTCWRQQSALENLNTI